MLSVRLDIYIEYSGKYDVWPPVEAPIGGNREYTCDHREPPENFRLTGEHSNAVR